MTKQAAREILEMYLKRTGGVLPISGETVICGREIGNNIESYTFLYLLEVLYFGKDKQETTEILNYILNF